MTQDWTKPQRRPFAGLAVVFINTLWEILKRLWPFLLIALLGGKEGKVNRYEIMGIVLFSITIISAVLQFLFFRFYIEDDRLVIKKGWLKKVTKVIPLEKIQTVHIEQGPVHQALGIVKLSIDTAGSQKAEASIDALRRSMAEALREQLVAQGKEREKTGARQEEGTAPLIRLSGADLLRLSISANHLEAFFLLLSFVIGLYENLKDINNGFVERTTDFLPQGSLYAILFFAIAILLITIGVSTARIFFRFYNFRVFQTPAGFYIASGLTHIRERVVSLQKIQFISWKESWIHRLFGLAMLEYHVTGNDTEKNKHRVQLPITRPEFVPALTQRYHPLPAPAAPGIRIHPSYTGRRLLIAGILPALVIIPPLWFLVEWYALLFLAYPFLIGLSAHQVRRKFRLWMMPEVLYIKKGFFGSEWQLLRWHKLQSVMLKQSLYQRHHGLATVVILTAAGFLRAPHIKLEEAMTLVNYALYKEETSREGWI